jgi:hypothetical protein
MDFIYLYNKIAIQTNKLRMLVTLIVLLSLTTFVNAQTCPLRCPSCIKCDPKRGTCSLPRDFVTCTKSGVAGVCFAGTCNAQLTLPSPVPKIGKCQTMKCPVSGQCTLANQPDGFDCTPAGAAAHSICMAGVCTPVLLGLGDTFPLQNIGCIGVANGAHCDTNDVLTDGERCMNDVCQFPDGYYYGYKVAVAPA